MKEKVRTLLEEEALLLRDERLNANSQARVGLALSGGGIRSATFSLGFLQALAERGLLGQIDYLSTVSGGGYIGSALGAMYCRQAAGGREKPDGAPDPVAAKLTDPQSPELRWLRENGRYLAPNGSGGLLTLVGTYVRNWLSIHVVLGIFLVAVFVLLDGLRAAVHGLARGCEVESWILHPFRHVRLPSWLEAAPVCGAAPAHGGFPSAISWSPYLLAPIVFLFFALGIGWAYWLVKNGGADDRRSRRIAWAVHTGLIAAGGTVLAGRTPIQFGRTGALSLQVFLIETLLAAAAAGIAAGLFGDDASERLTSWFCTGLWLAFAAVAFGLIDSAGATFARDPALLGKALGAIVSIGAIVATFANKIAVLVQGPVSKRRAKLPLSALASVAALLLVTFGLITFDGVGHLVATRLALVSRPLIYPAAILASFVLSAGIGHVRAFVNASSFHPIYTSRLTRAYLGASNPDRQRSENQALTKFLAGEDFSMGQYAPHAHGGPIHLINVTVNETLDGRSQVEQHDRHGLPLCVGPAGISVGARHSLVRSKAGEFRPGPIPEGAFAVFPSKNDKPYKPEDLSLGEWIAVSGAAFSTGMGSRTSLGLSLLTGIFNVRLGYWWKSGVDGRKDAGATTNVRKGGGAFAFAFPVQSHLLDEFLSRFHGTALREWYLSDGGHFENTGGYELIRRRVPLILLSDNGADPGFKFEDLANLVRKARVDFGAEITFLNRKEIDGCVEGKIALFAAEPGATNGFKAHFCIAIVRYFRPGTQIPDDRKVSVLIVAKPCVTGDESLDVLQYHGDHEDFPQQTTADQFFDEAQWESYRRLGLHIGRKLLEPMAGFGPQSVFKVPVAEVVRLVEARLTGGATEHRGSTSSSE